MEFFIDSCIFIEALKQKGKEEASEIWQVILEVLSDPKIEFFTNIIVYSETIFRLIVKGKKKSFLLDEYIYKIFKVLSWLSLGYEVKGLVEKYIKTYN
jgi:predicted nucleic acid-binding protein